MEEGTKAYIRNNDASCMGAAAVSLTIPLSGELE
jgi:hypothetical protein